MTDPVAKRPSFMENGSSSRGSALMSRRHSPTLSARRASAGPPVARPHLSIICSAPDGGLPRLVERCALAGLEDARLAMNPQQVREAIRGAAERLSQDHLRTLIQHLREHRADAGRRLDGWATAGG